MEHQDANIVVSDIVIGDLDVNCSKVRKQHDAAAATSYTYAKYIKVQSALYRLVPSSFNFLCRINSLNLLGLEIINIGSRRLK